jgi:glycosyltransferase involved in cell wall biosynthesis
MLADVDLTGADGSRSHVTEIARGFVLAGRSVELVARGADPQIVGVRFHRADGKGPGRVRRILGMNRTSLAILVAMRRRTRLLYYRFDAGLVGAVLVARLLGYRPVGEINNLAFGHGDRDTDGGLRESLVDRGKVVAMGVARRVTPEFVAVSDKIMELMISSYGVAADRIHVLPNGVDTERFHPMDRSVAATRVRLDPSHRYVVFVGFLAPWNDFSTMLHGFGEAARTRPDVQFVLVGDGPEMPLIDALVEKLDLDDRVIRTGSVTDRDRVSAYLGAATVCVVAHHGAMLQRIGGGSPMKMMEYFAAGRAVVATATEATATMINSTGGGIVVPDADIAAMAAAIGELLDHPQRADELGCNGRRAALERYSWTPVVATTIALLDGVA